MPKVIQLLRANVELTNRFCDPYYSVNFTVITALFLDSVPPIVKDRDDQSICRTKIRLSGILVEYSSSISKGDKGEPNLPDEEEPASRAVPLLTPS